MLKGNKGEWSEIYAFLKLLSDGRLYAADSRLNKIETMYFPILKIIREEKQGSIYEYLPGRTIDIYFNGEKILEKRAEEFEKKSQELLSNISDKKMKGAIEIKNVEDFLSEIHCHRLAAPSVEKHDITMKIRDINTGYENKVGFSIKSELGAAATLLNAGQSTNFIYELGGDYSENEVKEINKLLNPQGGTNIKGKVRKIYEEGYLVYTKTNNEIFANNLILIDSLMDKILAQMLIYFYRDSIKNCEELVAKIEEDNPLNFGNKYAYRYKMKKFLVAVALGLKPATEWDGVDEATGGYVIVTKKGEVLAYHIYNRNYFEDYLLANTKFETASTSRHKFGEVYKQNEKFYIKLNLQIRFN